MVDGIDVYSLNVERQADFRHEYVGFVFQQLQLLPYLTALENVLLSLAIARLPRSEKLARAREALALVGLEGKEDRLPYQLSGGEQGRVAVARAIVNQPPLLLADEPTGNLDRATGEQVLALLRELNAQGQTVIMVTHDPQAASYAGRTVQILDGQIVTDGDSPTAVRQLPHTARIRAKAPSPETEHSDARATPHQLHCSCATLLLITCLTDSKHP